MADEPTEDDTETLRYINNYREAEGYPPSVREVADHLGMSKSGTHWRLQRLVRDGLLRPPRPGARTMALTREAMKYITSPLEQL